MSLERGIDGFAVCSQIMTAVPDEVTNSMRAAVCGQLAALSSEVTLLALIDGALLRNMSPRAQRYWQIGAAQSLLPPGTADTAVKVGPLLFEVPVRDLSDALVRSLVDMATGHMVGSLLIAKTNSGHAAKALEAFVDVKLEDGAEMIMRFYDPRVLPFWLEGLPDAYQRHLGATISHWFHWGPDLKVRSMEFMHSAEGITSIPRTEFPMRIPSQWESQLMNATIPFLVLGRLGASEPQCLANIPHSKRYGFIQSQLERAAVHGLSTLGDLEAYCGLAAAFGVGFDACAPMDAILRDVKAGKAFDQAIASLRGSDWQQMREAVR